jgi:hypothetical protein
MTAATRRDIIVGVLKELYRWQPTGKTAAQLHRLLVGQIECDQFDVDVLLKFMKDRGWLLELPATDFDPTLDPFWVITPLGKREAVERRLV